MEKRKRRNPLIKRIPRELLGDWRKYLVVSLFLILTIGFVSGMYVANGSMMKAAEEGVSKYKLEDGHFELDSPADPQLLAAIETGEKADVAEETYELNDPEFEAVPVRLYDNFFRNEEEDWDLDGAADGTVRVYARNEEINLACLMEGRFPETETEIAIDRMHAENVGMKVGDTVSVGGQEFQITGLIAYVNYATLHEKSTDLMFDALKFDVAMVTDEGFDRLAAAVHYTYAWKYEQTPENETEEKKASDDFLKALLTQTVVYENEIQDYMPGYANPAIHFATDDMGSDEAMGGVLLDILIVIIAFIFAVTISNTIARESQTIGTLRALGYTRGELLGHYLSMPVIVTLISAAVGNLLGYSVFKNVVVSMYYNSYSLPVYETVWNWEAFLKTTLIPTALMLAVNLAVIARMLRHTPLQSLRHDLKKTRRKKALRLPSWSFPARFRLRIIFQNIPNYLILFAGIFFIMVLLAMAVGMPSTLGYYKEHAGELMFADYQYVLKAWQDQDGIPVVTENPDAEPFCMTALQKKGEALDEEISVYGIGKDSRYVRLEELDGLEEGEAILSASFADKYEFRIGDAVALDEKYENRQYVFTVAGIYENCQSLAVFLPLEQYRAVFGLEQEAFDGYLSNTELADIGEDEIAAVITERDITKMCDQLDHSMGAYMEYFQILCILLSAALIYLLTKLIIERNETAISMTKILGYENREIAGLYLLSTTLVVLLAEIVSVWLGGAVMKLAWRMIMMEYSGWFAFVIEPLGYVKMFAFVLIGYLLVLIVDFRRIRKIPMDEALKNVE